jgi:hypothetical protein
MLFARIARKCSLKYGFNITVYTVRGREIKITIFNIIFQHSVAPVNDLFCMPILECATSFVLATEYKYVAEVTFMKV